MHSLLQIMIKLKNLNFWLNFWAYLNDLDPENFSISPARSLSKHSHLIKCIKCQFLSSLTARAHLKMLAYKNIFWPKIINRCWPKSPKLTSCSCSALHLSSTSSVLELYCFVGKCFWDLVGSKLPGAFASELRGACYGSDTKRSFCR